MLIHDYYHSLGKRVFDITLASIGLIVFSPIMGMIALLILLTDGSPILFTQKRLGKNKQSFLMYKFRVMYVGAEKDQRKYWHLNIAPSPMYKSWDDPRYVGLGKLLSKTGLDELPQILNILKGEMSFVGPRPLPVKEANKLSPAWNFRFKVKPGVLSEWSASKQRHTSLQKWKQLESNTLAQGGIFYDVGLLARTIKQIILNQFS